MSKAPPRAVPDYAKRLEDLRPAFERLKAERIRAESDIARLAKELEEARRQAREAFGTDDEDEIRARIAAEQARNDAAVEAFAALIRDIGGRLAQLGPEG
jgi:phage shock protein A